MQLPGAYLSEFFFSVFLFLVVSVSWTFHALSCSLGTYCAHLAKKLQNRLILCQVSFSHLSSLCVNVSFLGYLILSLGRLNSMLYALKEPSEPSLCHTVLWLLMCLFSPSASLWTHWEKKPHLSLYSQAWQSTWHVINVRIEYLTINAKLS